MNLAQVGTLHELGQWVRCAVHAGLHILSVDGYTELMTEPRLGIGVEEKAVHSASEKGRGGGAPEWHHRDGSFAQG